ncbi:DNA cytosine methyltransferase [Paenibacillus hunanensis]|uniref:DNA (cytosine-5-)-methyltransferase n=1 Tax=Paenibacillus hunanensis TaxID=539262 RepID=A0ABU1IWV0_9BACL|nr:DNA cytosine methyltransferase [Paenibacillus hunanensis]MDR6243172.1 DNA (cytosine-5)-methyltransferase 1 [Paenibacillus hunanensis]GGJ11301.1 DNA methyltransferase [Paenibacillus hunanensis]
MQEIIVDNFAGGGGASTGIELATGRSVDIAINHDPAAIAMHRANHPDTEHYCESVWDIDPREVVKGRPVGLVWLSPDCKHFSKAKGGKPVEKGIRGLAWVAIRWAATVKPRVIMLENVEEFKTWGPLMKDGYPDPAQKGRTFNSFVNALKRQGYEVQTKELRACDYGAPTIRKRLFMVARCDNQPITWPEPTHGAPDSPEVLSGKLQPWRTAAEIIDWDIPAPSIFERKRPLAENTLRRIARGIQRFVVDSPNPFVMRVNFSGSNHHYCDSIDEPLKTITSKNGWGIVTPYIARIGQTGFGGDRLQYKATDPLTTITTKAEHMLITPVLGVNTSGHPGGSVDDPLKTVTTGGHHMLIAPMLTQYHTETDSNSVRGQTVDQPILTLDTSNRYGLVAAFLAKHYGGNYTGAGTELTDPLSTVTTVDHNALVTSHLVKLRGTCADGQPVTDPMPTITAGGLHVGEVRAFLLKYYGSADNGQQLNEPLHTVTTKDRFGLVTVEGVDYQIVDIGMRMLEPHELFAAQGFPANYIIDMDADGKRYAKSAQVARCGNAVPPPFAQALVRANLPELCTGSGNQLTVERYKEAVGQVEFSI